MDWKMVEVELAVTSKLFDSAYGVLYNQSL